MRSDPEKTVPGLLAVGEAACVSVHGANRLGSNSLIDLVVFGRAAGLKCAETVEPNSPHAELPPMRARRRSPGSTVSAFAAGGTPTAELRLRMQKTMQDYCAVFRTGDILSEGAEAPRRSLEGNRRYPRHRPVADLEFRSDRDARI